MYMPTHKLLKFVQESLESDEFFKSEIKIFQMNFQICNEKLTTAIIDVEHI